jgi:hypothetical protein
LILLLNSCFFFLEFEAFEGLSGIVIERPEKVVYFSCPYSF